MTTLAPTREQLLIGRLLRDLAVLRAWRLALPGCRSPLGYQLEALRVGALGDGCSGTRGAGGREAPEPQPAPAPHPLDARYRALEGLPGHRVRQLLVEGHTTRIDAPARTLYAPDLGAGPRVAPVDLDTEQAVGWWGASTRQRAAWAAKVITRDRAPALAGMRAAGTAILVAAAKEWIDSE